MFFIFILVQCLALQTFCQYSEVETENVPETDTKTEAETEKDTNVFFPDNEDITTVLKNPNKSLEKTTRGIIGPFAKISQHPSLPSRG